MTKLLEEAIERVKALPDDAQDEMARMLLAVLDTEEEPVVLDEETRAAVREGLEQARRGEFAPDEEIAEFFRLHRG